MNMDTADQSAPESDSSGFDNCSSPSNDDRLPKVDTHFTSDMCHKVVSNEAYERRMWKR